ncbi:caprin-2-like [Cyprinodon tularosa]|uniref:caprin-2-like n=1 Tax=Cyprinodon tularosa TaxID=77115 RepID=UPI0018E22F62|nr:caprin-2-like [Cyprinodon tularosa]
METRMIFPLLLLVCSVCPAQLQTVSDKDIVSPAAQVGEAEHLSGTQQTCTQDINAVLREMSACLAELRVEVRHLQKDNEAQAEELMTVKAKVDITENQVEALKREGEAQAAELVTVKVKANVTADHVEALQRDGEVKRLAFSASLFTSGSGNFGPFNTHTTLVFGHVVTNIGNAYSPSTGLFTAPVRGVYHFEFHLYGHGSSSSPTSAVLVRNGEEIIATYENQPSGGQKTSNGVTPLLNVGDSVFMRMRANSWIHDNPDHHTTFSGHLLFTM